MTSDWLNDSFGSDEPETDCSQNDFYCPYTDGANCAVLENGWQPQELCDALECNQLKLFRKNMPKNYKDAA